MKIKKTIAEKRREATKKKAREMYVELVELNGDTKKILIYGIIAKKLKVSPSTVRNYVVNATDSES